MEKTILNPEHILFVTSNRIKYEDERTDLYYYDVRHSDECGMTASSITEFVGINHMLTVVMSHPLDLGSVNELLLEEADEDILMKKFDDRSISISEVTN